MSIQKPCNFTRTPLPLPYDLLHLLLQDLLSSSSFHTLATLARLSKEYYSHIIPLIYRHVHITSDEQLQSFLTIPLTRREESDKKKRKIVDTVLGKNRSRSNSLEDTSGGNRKIQNLSLVQSLTLDVYPSRTSFKLSSKLPQPLQTPLLTFTPHALENLQEKLSRSGAPRILVSFWAKHLPGLVMPRKIIVDYSTLDLSEDEEGRLGDTMSGMSISLQSWSESCTLQEVELRGERWLGILPGPGVGVRMIHTSTDLVDGDSNTIEDGEGEVEDLVTVNETLLNPSNEPSPTTLALIESRNKLVSQRVQSLILGLRTSQALSETYHSPAPLDWSMQGILPRPIGVEEMDDEERYVENQREKRKVVDDILNGLDEVCPKITQRYGRIGEDGRRELGCLTWVE
ncbi:hypothetical protein I302_108775 [Kwoniella bestiolae CBS 10118]|uniref:Uncharacterized protein n=1 Tax=Kwoniella bestiolae CBS 10118 TaxID=1296100 RepID=A0A1B9FU15_9TREE|nr:hypothetical protein I302_07912 [Kwoniella bestiolae CBS 10118]OCF22267.1 hypothetical protein I302_07912 [Kwoniella bestiolae CBS 10118]